MRRLYVMTFKCNVIHLCVGYNPGGKHVLCKNKMKKKKWLILIREEWYHKTGSENWYFLEV